jgi:hypothetical protein
MQILSFLTKYAFSEIGIWPNAVSPKSEKSLLHICLFILLLVYLIFFLLFCAVCMVNQFLSRNLLIVLLVMCICVHFIGG